ncbi:MAG: carbohydrate ABC transporter substrate-binding protein [Chloroflexia bacterium]|nr:carbohydrate ABC transporter substrate-binding protein [Chloroflexia bacterium]
MLNKKMFWFLSVLLVASMMLAACGATETSEPTPAGPAQDTGTIFVMGPFRGEEEAAFQQVIAVFEAENPDIDVIYAGTAEFETLINVRVEAGDPPDIAAIPQPGLMMKFAEKGQIVPLWDEIIALYDHNYSPAWKELGSYKGVPYGLFHRVNAKGWIWYNKPAFESAGYTVPATWDDLMALSGKIAAAGTPPWCIGIESGAATGWVGTDWMENLMLRTQPVEKYDQWISHELKFDSPEVKGAWEVMDSIWMDDTMVYGGPATIATTDFKIPPTWLFDDPPKCWLHLQGSFVTNFFPEDVQADLDNQVGVFMMPPIDPSLPTTLEVGGDQYVMFQDRPEVRKFMEFLTTGASADPWIAQGGALFPHQDQDLSLYPTDIERTMAKAILTAEAARFDASDSMASAGNLAFWKGITEYVGGKSIDAVLQGIDAAFP